jgi:plasmid rolling circle replication initiator protein Rep
MIQKKHLNTQWLFLTLTVKNCGIENLRKTIQAMNYGFRKLKGRKNWQALGWIKAIEVTRGFNNSAHPHFHILLHMPSSYFGKYYIKQADWMIMWKKCMKLDYEPNIDIRGIRPNTKKGKNNLVSVISEMAKYTTKPNTFIDYPNWFLEYSKQIHQMRFVDSGGSLRGILADDYENLIEVNEETEEDERMDADVRFCWNKKIRHYVKKNE